MSEDGVKHEIVIIRRGGHSHDEGHHGGMWKIAYADFMTAMMALFLVLWLVNSSDEKTLTSISSYFNPIELSDKITTERGVQDKNQAGSGTVGTQDPAQSGNTKDTSTPRNSLEKSGNAEEALFTDPYEVLNKIAAKAAKSPGKGGTAASGAKSGEVFRDPFDPDFRSSPEEVPELANSAAKTPKPAETADGGGSKGVEGEQKDKAGRAMAFDDTLAREVEEAAKKAREADAAKDASEAGPTPKSTPAISAEAAEINKQILQDMRASGLAALPDISVKQTSEGILISVTDKVNFEMFGLSSAEPKPELVVLMEKLAGVLAKQPGQIVVRGHTDARPFRSKTYDNWRLSTSRAHIAQYMLVRGGLAEKRIERVEGYADHAPKNAKNPDAPENRRIEILVKPEKA